MINSDYVIKAQFIYEFDGKMIILLDYMNGKELTNIINDFSKNYTEDFIKYTLFCAATGLADLHNKGLIHRDIKSDNIFCSTDG